MPYSKLRGLTPIVIVDKSFVEVDICPASTDSLSKLPNPKAKYNLGIYLKLSVILIPYIAEGTIENIERVS